MFSARKKGAKKEQPQWKRDLEGHSDEEQPAKRVAAPSAPADAGGCSSSAEPQKDAGEALQRASHEASCDVDGGEDDDDDDDFDPSNYDLGAGAEQEDDEEKPPWASSSSVANPIPPGALPTRPVEYCAGPMKGARYVDVDGRDTICFHSKGASNEVCQTLVGTLPGYRATRFVRELVFVLFSDHTYAAAAMETLNKTSLADESGKKSHIRTEWAKRSLRPY